MFCALCNIQFRDNYNYKRHRATKKCQKKHKAILDFQMLESNCELLIEKDLLEGEIGVADKLWVLLELQGKYKVLDASRKKFAFVDKSGKVIIDNNCYKLIKFCQPIVNKKVEYYFGSGAGDWLELAHELKQKVLSTKDLGSIFIKRILQLAFDPSS